MNELTKEQELRSIAIQASANSFIRGNGYVATTKDILKRADRLYSYILTGSK